jgi:CO/xanthine dehydrogenase FAD-binding subunit
VSIAVSARIYDGSAIDVRIALGGQGQPPVLAPAEVAAALAGSIDDAAIDHVVETWVARHEFGSDSRAGAQHRRLLAGNVVARLLRRLREDLQ